MLCDGSELGRQANAQLMQLVLHFGAVAIRIKEGGRSEIGILIFGATDNVRNRDL